MAATWDNQLQTVYNISGNPVVMFPAPIVKNVAPTVTDYAQPGSIWIYKPAAPALSVIYINVSNAIGAALWRILEAGGGAGGPFTSLVTTTGPVTLNTTLNQANVISATTNGGALETINFTNTQGTNASAINFSALAGGATFSSALAMRFTSTFAGAGSFFFNVAGAGGSAAFALPDALGASLVSIQNSTPAVIFAVNSLGRTTAVQLGVNGDVASGVAGQVAITNNVALGLGVGVNTLLASGAAPFNNAGYIKFYVGTTVAYVPYWVAGAV